MEDRQVLSFPVRLINKIYNMSGQAMIKKEYKVKSSASGQRRREKAGDMLNPTVLLLVQNGVFDDSEFLQILVI